MGRSMRSANMRYSCTFYLSLERWTKGLARWTRVMEDHSIESERKPGLERSPRRAVPQKTATGAFCCPLYGSRFGYCSIGPSLGSGMAS